MEIDTADTKHFESSLKSTTMKRKLLNASAEVDSNTTSDSVVLPESTAYWSKEPYAWSTSLGYTPPLLTSSHCARALHGLFHNTYYDAKADPAIPNFLLSVVVESSSHPSGLNSLFAQPYLYAGPGLGNMDECPLQICLAGGRQTDTITFAALCIVPECSAYDLASEDFVSVANLQLNSFAETTPSETIQLGSEYVSVVEKMNIINQFLGTGWSCGNFVVPWSLGTTIPTLLLFLICTVLSWWGTTTKASRQQRKQHQNGGSSPSSSVLDRPETHHNGEASRPSTNSSSTFWAAWDSAYHAKQLVKPSPIPCLDGLRVGSMFWIILGHVMAIQSSMGAGYANPSNFLPPSGWTTTLVGQLLFSSRLAVDTFFVISGFLVVLVLYRKLPLPADGQQQSVFRRYVRCLPALVASRIARVVPLYAATLAFYTQIAPHLGGGPFWHQWLGLLQPCHDNIWTNLLFVNNFLPRDTPTIQTCFYHSWYLAVDMQLFCCAPLLILLFQTSPTLAKRVAWFVFVVSVIFTAYLAYAGAWSVNTFDGAAVDRYDVQAYAKPHVRVQAYIAGMYVGMRHLEQEARQQQRQRRMTGLQFVVLFTCLLVMTLVTFGTVTGAYAKRPCTYREEPFTNDCGSQWTSTMTWFYTSFSRPFWCLALGATIELCVGWTHVVNTILSLPVWTPLSHLTFGAYLIHPIVMFVWQIGDREKQIFRLSTFCMDYLSACVVSYAAAFFAAVTIEIPCAALWKSFVVAPATQRLATAASGKDEEGVAGSLITNGKSQSSHASTTMYGAINDTPTAA